MEASTEIWSGSDSSRVRTPVMPVNWPFTLEIIMCLTLNSATEWAGSMFQVVVAVCGACAHCRLLCVISCLLGIRCVTPIFVATIYVP